MQMYQQVFGGKWRYLM